MAALLKELKSIEPALRVLHEKRPRRISLQSVEWDRERATLGAAVHAMLGDFERYRGSENLMLTMGNGAGTIRPQYMWAKLLDLTVSRGATFAVTALTRLLAVDQARVKSLCLIWGVEVARPIRLASDVRIEPLPPGSKAAILQSEFSRHSHQFQTRSSFSLLSTEFVVSPVVMEAAECDKLPAPAIAAFEKFRDVASFLCAFGPAPVKLEQWCGSELLTVKLACSSDGRTKISRCSRYPDAPAWPGQTRHFCTGRRGALS